MIKRVFSYVIQLLTFSCCLSITVHAQSPALGIASLSSYVGLTKDALSKLLENPETLNKVLQSSLANDSKWKFFKDIDFTFKTMTSSSDSASALGFSYAFSKNIANSYLSSDETSQIGVSLSFDAKGNVSFEPKVNPVDFMTNDLSLHIFGSSGGAIATDSAVRTKLNQIQSQLVVISDKEELDKSPAWKEFSDLIQGYLSTQVYWDISAVGTFESDEQFIRKETAYGAQVGFDVKAWRQDDIVAKLNIFDWPFAALRWLSGDDPAFSPKGSTIPTLLIALQQVTPQKGDPREVLGEGGSFSRVRGEISFRTPLGSKGDYAAYFESDFRFYREISPPSIIKTAGLNEFLFATGAITLSNGFYVSYSSGKLPFDAKNDQIYELGFKYKL